MDLSMDTMREALEQARKGRLHILDAMYECYRSTRDRSETTCSADGEDYLSTRNLSAPSSGHRVRSYRRSSAKPVRPSISKKSEILERSAFSVRQRKVWKRRLPGSRESCPTGSGIGLRSQSKIRYALWCICGIPPGKQGLLHISEVSLETSRNHGRGIKEGDMVKVKLIGLDQKTGKFKLSRKVLMPKPEGKVHRVESVMKIHESIV